MRRLDMDALELLRLLLRYVHLVGFAVLLGAVTVQYLTQDGRLTTLVRVGLGTALVSGVVLAAPFPRDDELNYVKVGVKLAVAFAIGIVLSFSVRHKRPVTTREFGGIAGLAVVNAAVAVFWR
jgi:hypothetical protein